MNLTAPTRPVFIIALVLFIVGLLAHFAVIPAFAPPFYLVSAAFVILALGILLKGW